MNALFITHHWRYSGHLCYLWFQFSHAKKPHSVALGLEFLILKNITTHCHSPWLNRTDTDKLINTLIPDSWFAQKVNSITIQHHVIYLYNYYGYNPKASIWNARHLIFLATRDVLWLTISLEMVHWLCTEQLWLETCFCRRTLEWTLVVTLALRNSSFPQLKQWWRTLNRRNLCLHSSTLLPPLFYNCNLLSALIYISTLRSPNLVYNYTFTYSLFSTLCLTLDSKMLGQLVTV